MPTITAPAPAQTTTQSPTSLGNRIIGEIAPWPSDTLPSGWLLCDGSPFDFNTYPDLSAAIGYAYGSFPGDGVNGFAVGVMYPRLPDLRGRVPVGHSTTDAEFNALGKTGGAKTHTLTTTEMPSHAHTQASHDHALNAIVHTSGTTNAHQDAAVAGSVHTFGSLSSSTRSGSATPTINATGGDAAHNNLQPYVAVNYIIKAIYTSSEVPPTATHAHSLAEVNGLEARLPRVGTLDRYYSHGSTAKVSWSGPFGTLYGPYPLEKGYEPVPGEDILAVPTDTGSYVISSRAGVGRTYPYWFAPFFENDFHNYSDVISASPFALVGFTRNSSGIVMLRGLARHGSLPASNTTIFTLPTGFRPATKKMFLVSTTSTGEYGSGRVDVNPDGTVVFASGDPRGYLSLDGIYFLEAEAENALSWANISLGTGWTAYGGGWEAPARAIDNLGRVWHRGLVARTSGTSSTLWTVSGSYSPQVGGTIIQRMAAGNGAGSVDISSANVVHRAGPVSYMSLDQIIYPSTGGAYGPGLALGYSSPWTDYVTPPWSPGRLIKYPDQLMLLGGLVKATTGAAARGTIFTMASGAGAGQLPTKTLVLPIPSATADTGGRIDILNNGVVSFAGGDAQYVSLHAAYMAEA